METAMQTINAFILEMDNPNARTIYNYRAELQRYERFSNKRGGGMYYTATALQYKQELIREGVSAGTINTRIAILKVFAKWLESSGRTKGNFMQGVKNIKESNVCKIEAAQRDDVQKVLAAETNEQTRLIIMLGCFCGLRSHEISTLRHSDIAKGADGTLYIKVRGKGYNAEVSRLQPVPRKISKVVKALFDTSKGDAPVFTSESHRNGNDAMSTLTVQRRIKDAFARVGVKVSSHQLRHAYAVACFEQCKSVEVVKELLGHQQATTTLRYIHDASDSVKNSVINKIKY